MEFAWHPTMPKNLMTASAAKEWEDLLDLLTAGLTLSEDGMGFVKSPSYTHRRRLPTGDMQIRKL